VFSLVRRADYVYIGKNDFSFTSLTLDEFLNTVHVIRKYEKVYRSQNGMSRVIKII